MHILNRKEKVANMQLINCLKSDWDLGREMDCLAWSVWDGPYSPVSLLFKDNELKSYVISSHWDL